MASDSSLLVKNNRIILIMRPLGMCLYDRLSLQISTLMLWPSSQILYGHLTFFNRLMGILWVHHCMCMPLIFHQEEMWQYSSSCWLEWHSAAYVGKLGHHNWGCDIKACRTFGAKSLPQPVSTYWWMDPQEWTSVICNQNTDSFSTYCRRIWSANFF